MTQVEVKWVPGDYEFLADVQAQVLQGEEVLFEGDRAEAYIYAFGFVQGQYKAVLAELQGLKYPIQQVSVTFAEDLSHE